MASRLFLRGALFYPIFHDAAPCSNFKNLTKTYRTGDKALQDVTLTMPKGQVLALDRAVRRRQVDAHPLHQPPGGTDLGQGPA
jgi:hypothetical protein